VAQFRVAVDCECKSPYESGRAQWIKMKNPNSTAVRCKAEKGESLVAVNQQRALLLPFRMQPKALAAAVGPEQPLHLSSRKSPARHWAKSVSIPPLGEALGDDRGRLHR
jgi:hypothetical protein